MKYWFLFLFLIPFSVVYSQNIQLPEGGFENWSRTVQGNISYEEPAGSWWTTLNALAKLGGPVTVSRTGEAHSGDSAARLETAMWGTLVIPGLLVSGKFITSAPFIVQGQPFTAKPGRFKGFYKYTGINGDSAAIYAKLSRLNPLTLKQDTLAEAKMAVYANTTGYVAFDLPFDYYDNDSDPDSLTVVFTSSAAGQSFQGQAGSVLLIDEVSLEYSNGLGEPLGKMAKLEVSPVPASSSVHVRFTGMKMPQTVLFVLNSEGKHVLQCNNPGTSFNLDISGWPTGAYVLWLVTGETVIARSRIIVSR